MEAAPTISIIGARAIALGAAAGGLELPDFCTRFGLDPATLADVDARIDAATMLRMWKEVPEVVGDDDFGLHIGEMGAIAGPALPWHLLRASDTFGDGIRRILEAWRVFNDVNPYVFTEEGDVATLSIPGKTSSTVAPRHAIEFVFAWFVGVARRSTGKHVVPRAITFEHAAPARTTEHTRIFECEVRFGADVAALVFPRDVLALPSLERDPELVELLAKHARALLAKLPLLDEHTRRVREAMTPLLPRGEIDGARVARAMRTSARTLQRRLAEEKTTFQRVLDDLRRDLALGHLVENEYSIAEIALLLGFSDQSTFHRAFVRWTGATPGAIRRAGGIPTAGDR